MKHHPLALATQRCVLGVLLMLASTRAPAADSRAPAADSPPAVVCFGDSITKRGYPDELGKRLGVATINAGVGGNTTTAGLKRMQREVLDLKPRVVVIFFGTNDSRVDAPKIHVPVDHYVANLRQMITRCAAIQARVVLCTVPPINPKPYFQRHVQAAFDEAGGLSKILEGYRAAVRRLGTELDLPVVDLAQQLASEPAWLSADGVHPTPAGNAILAKLIAEQVSPLLGSRPAPHANP
jgi:lysophospholipase L1-like esterase